MTRTSFAGALRRAMSSFNPPLTSRDVALLTGDLSEEAVDEIASGLRRPNLYEMGAIAEALELPLEKLLANQRLTRGGGDE